jgi:hypothetical protein
MRQQRTRVVINVGNLLEVLGAASAVYGVARLAGLGFALVLAGILAVVAAELIYDGHAWRIPLPHRPRPRAWAQRRRRGLRSKRIRLRTEYRLWRRRHRRADAWTGKANL